MTYIRETPWRRCASHQHVGFSGIGNAWDGQRCRVPTGSSAFSKTGWRDHWPGGRRWRIWRLSFAVVTRRYQGQNWRIWHWPADVRDGVPGGLSIASAEGDHLGAQLG